MIDWNKVEEGKCCLCGEDTPPERVLCVACDKKLTVSLDRVIETFRIKIDEEKPTV